MADWRDKYREGSFRGVDFLITSHQLIGGRRKQDREFAKREIGNSEDLGKRLNTFTLEIFVLGDNYFEQRDNLIDALETEGAGILIHPYLGTKNVQAGNYTLSETVDEGRLARFSVQFTEAGEIKFPDNPEDDLTATIENAAAVEEDSRNIFEKIFDTANQAASVVQSAADAVDSVVDFMEDAVKKVTEPIANLTSAISNIKASVGDLIKLPGELAALIADMFNTLLGELSGDEDTASRILSQFANVDDSFVPVIGDTPSREKQRGNQDAIINLAKELALAGNARAVVEIDFVSTNAALEKQREIISGLDLQLDEAGDDELFQSIKELQTSLTKVLPRTGTTELITITPIITIPALVIAYDQFEDLDKEDEIVDQNAIEHPGFVPGGDPIQISAG